MLDLFSSLPQFVANGLVAGTLYALVAYGLGLYYFSSRTFHFAHGAVVAASAHFMWLFFSQWKLDLFLSVLLTVACATILGLLANRLLYRPLRHQKATNAVFLIASLSLLVFLQSVLLFVFGADVKSLSRERTASLALGSVTVTELEIVVVATALILFGMLWLFLNRTQTGRSLRALSANKDLAEICGIDPEKTYALSIALASAIAGLAGILIGFQQNAEPFMGTFIIIAAFTGLVIGGLDSLPGILAGALLLGLAENVGIAFLPSGYKAGIAFSLLFLFLIFRPQGLFGRFTEVRT